MEELKKMSCVDLISLWIDIMRPQTQWTDKGGKGVWSSSPRYNKCIENIEDKLATKLAISLLGAKILLNSKKKMTDAYEANLFNVRKRKLQAIEEVSQ